MKHIHIVEPYGSVAMQRMSAPLLQDLPKLYVVSQGQTPDDSADLNFHIPYHTLVGYETKGNSRHVMTYTHCNPPDVGNLLDACSRADLIVCMSFQGRRELVDIGVDPQKLWVIYSAADGFQYRRRTIGIIGFAQPNGRKRESILTDLAWQHDLSPFHFVIAGGGWEPTVNALRNLGVSVDYVPFADDGQLRELYKLLDALLVTGYAEGGPLPLLEAMASGVPVISPCFGYAADLLFSSQIYDDVDELWQRLEEIAAPSVFAHQLARSWSWQNYAMEHAFLFGRLLGESVDLFPEWGMGRYSQIVDVVEEVRPRSICEIGTWNGNRAIQMIQAAQQYNNDVRYVGFDLFEEQTGEQLRRELSKAGWPMEIVQRRIEATRAKVNLVKGDTRDTIKSPLLYANQLYFVDGGHSEATIRNDAEAVLKAMTNKAVAIFDDYYHAGQPQGVGCNAIIDELDREQWEVTHLPVRTLTSDGREIGMVKVRRNADIHLQMPEPTYTGSYPYTTSIPPNSLLGVSGDHVASAANCNGELGRTSAAS